MLPKGHGESQSKTKLHWSFDPGQLHEHWRLIAFSTRRSSLLNPFRLPVPPPGSRSPPSSVRHLEPTKGQRVSEVSKTPMPYCKCMHMCMPIWTPTWIAGLSPAPLLPESSMAQHAPLHLWEHSDQAYASDGDQGSLLGLIWVKWCLTWRRSKFTQEMADQNLFWALSLIS